MIKNIFFDFDGVILDSVNAKAEAFYELYLPYGKDVALKVVEHHKANGGVSRFEKIPYYHKTFLNKKLTNNGLEKFCNKFSKITFEKVINAPKVEGIEKFLEKYHKQLNFWVISATPTDELRKIVEAIGYNNFFIDVLGSPQNKSFWIKTLIKENDLLVDETIMIGDSLSDYDAAINNKIKFILRLTSETNKLLQSSIRVSKQIENFLEFSLEKINEIIK